jgi:hypothetical protein
MVDVSFLVYFGGALAEVVEVATGPVAPPAEVVIDLVTVEVMMTEEVDATEVVVATAVPQAEVVVAQMPASLRFCSQSAESNSE